MTLSQASSLFSALGNDSRLGMIRVLIQEHPRPVSVGVLAKLINKPLWHASEQLISLERSGLVQKDQMGQYVGVRVNVVMMNELKLFLMELTRKIAL